MKSEYLVLGSSFGVGLDAYPPFVGMADLTVTWQDFSDVWKWYFWCFDGS